MTMNKPTIPREVAAAICSYREEGRENAFIITLATNRRPVTPRGVVLQAFADDHFDDFLAALVNGYDVEKTAEEAAHERIRDWYTMLSRLHDHVDTNASLREVAWARMDTVRDVLNMLGVKITGVNA